MTNLFAVWNLGYSISTTRSVFMFTLAIFSVLAVASKLVLQIRRIHSDDAITFRRLASWVQPEFKFDAPELFLIISLGMAIVVTMLNPSIMLPFVPRTLSVVSIPYFILLAREGIRVRPRLVQWISIMVCGSLMLWATTISRGQSAGIDWHRLAGYIKHNVDFDDIVFVNPSEYLPALAL